MNTTVKSALKSDQPFTREVDAKSSQILAEFSNWNWYLRMTEDAKFGDRLFVSVLVSVLGQR